MKKKFAIIIAISLFSLVSLQSSSAEEKILPWDALKTEKQFRSTIEARFPDLNFGFYHFTGDWMLAALEDFDQDRILLVVPTEAGAEKVTLTRNGKELDLPPGEPVSIKIAGILMTPDGNVSDKKNAVEQRIGYWINLEATESLSLVLKLSSPSEAEFKVTYDPDLLWKTSFLQSTDEKDKKKPADAYEISRKSLLNRVLEVLTKQNECLVRLKLPSDLIITTQEIDNDSNIDPLYTTLSNKIEIGTGEHAEVKSANEYDENVQLYRTAARAAGDRPRITILVNTETDDQIFRDTLITLAKHQFSKIRLVVNLADKK